MVTLNEHEVTKDMSYSNQGNECVHTLHRYPSLNEQI